MSGTLARSSGRAGQRGFTLLELMVAFAIAAALIGVSTPAVKRMYDTMQYREALRDLRSAAAGARYHAIVSGVATDMVVDPDEHWVASRVDGEEVDEDAVRPINKALTLAVVSAEELLTPEGQAVIRFYPDGSSSGGSIQVTRESGGAERLRIDWLLGRITREDPK